MKAEPAHTHCFTLFPRTLQATHLSAHLSSQEEAEAQGCQERQGAQAGRDGDWKPLVVQLVLYTTPCIPSGGIVGTRVCVCACVCVCLMPCAHRTLMSVLGAESKAKQDSREEFSVKEKPLPSDELALPVFSVPHREAP